MEKMVPTSVGVRGPMDCTCEFNPEVERDARPGDVDFGDFVASSSRYADPEAEGVTPVFRTVRD